MFGEIKKLLVDNKTTFKGVVHIGAHLGEEFGFYDQDMMANDIVWIEANPETHEKLLDNLSMRGAYNDQDRGAEQVFVNACLSDKDGESVTFHVTSHTASSSFLDLDLHKKYYPDIVVTKEIPLTTKTFETVVKENNLDMRLYDFLCIDVQGAEMKVLAGMGEHLSRFNKICIEVNSEHLYKNCPLTEDIDCFLKKHGFTRTETVMTTESWGEALYEKI